MLVAKTSKVVPMSAGCHRIGIGSTRDETDDEVPRSVMTMSRLNMSCLNQPWVAQYAKILGVATLVK